MLMTTSHRPRSSALSIPGAPPPLRRQALITALLHLQVRKDWRALKSSVGVLESVGPEQEHAELAAASKQLRASLATAQKVLDLDSGAADAFHANVIALAEATQAAQDQLRVNVVRRDIETTRVRRLTSLNHTRRFCLLRSSSVLETRAC